MGGRGLVYRWVRGCGGQRAGVQVGEGVWGAEGWCTGG